MHQQVLHSKLKRRAAALLLAAALGGCAQHSAPPDHIVTGQPFPTLQVNDLEGRAAVLAVPFTVVLAAAAGADGTAAAASGGVPPPRAIIERASAMLEIIDCASWEPGAFCVFCFSLCAFASLLSSWS